jgi:LPS export ABC transporter protein LptC
MRALWGALLGAAVVATASCRDTNQPPVAATPGVADSADQVLFNARFLLTTRGIQRAEVRADTAYILDNQTRLSLRKAHAVFTTETGAPQGTMDADRAVYRTGTQVLEGWGDVVVRMVDGSTLKSPHVVYNQAAHQITSDTTYSTSDPRRGTSTGIGFISNQSFTSGKCLRNCGGNFSVAFPER